MLTSKCIVDVSSTLWANTSEDTLEIVQTLQSQSRFKKKRTTKSVQNLLTIEIATPIAISIIERQSRGQKWEKLERLRCGHLRLAIARKPIPRTT